MRRPDEIDRGREYFAARLWGDAYRTLLSADRVRPLGGDDLELLATSAYLIGEASQAASAWARGHRAHLDAGSPDRAALLGSWVCLDAILGGDISRGTGWLSRTRRVLKKAGDCPAQGYVLVLEGLLALGAGAPVGQKFSEAVAIAEQFTDPDILALALLGEGQASIGRQRFAEGKTLLDEAMIGVSSGDVSPILSGIVYCAAILACQGIFDFGRASEWTEALDAWCNRQQDLRPFRGQCSVHRSEILQRRGDWAAALDEVTRAVRYLPGRLGHALYQRGELSRLRGDFDDADRLYGEAEAAGFGPQPGASLLVLARGDVDAAASAISGSLDVAGQPTGFGRAMTRPRILGAFVEIQLAAGGIGPAEIAAAELSDWAAAMGSNLLLAESQQARGAVLLATDRAQESIGALREAWGTWQRLRMPYESARVRMLMGSACDALGERAAGEPHFEAARDAFFRLGAAPDLARVETRLTHSESDTLGLTRRQLEVLAILTSGASNREIASQLNISEHTVARHVSNIFDKLGATSRTEASAIAHARRLSRHHG